MRKVIETYAATHEADENAESEAINEEFASMRRRDELYQMLDLASDEDIAKVTRYFRTYCMRDN